MFHFVTKSGVKHTKAHYIVTKKVNTIFTSESRLIRAASALRSIDEVTKSGDQRKCNERNDLVEREHCDRPNWAYIRLSCPWSWRRREDVSTKRQTTKQSTEFPDVFFSVLFIEKQNRPTFERLPLLCINILKMRRYCTRCRKTAP